MASIQGIYVALFGRPADPDGLAYWNSQTKNGTDLTNLIGQMTKSSEYQTKFEGQSTSQVISSIYQSLFGHAPDAEGLKYWVDGFTSGKFTLDTIAISVLDGAQGDDAKVIANKVVAADEFTKSLDTPAEIAAYKGVTAIANGLTFLSKVTADTSSIPTQAAVDAAVSTVNAPSSGLAPGGNGGAGTGAGAETPTTPTLFKLTGANGDETGGSQGHWVTDRSPLGSVTTQNDPLGSSNKVLAFKLSGVVDSLDFHGYAGVALKTSANQAWEAEAGSHVTYKFFIDSNWNSDGIAQETGLWVQMQNAGKTLPDGGLFSIAEYMDSDAVVAAAGRGDVAPSDFKEGFRFWSSESGWTYAPGTAGKAGWVNLDFSFNGTSTTWNVDGATAYQDSGSRISTASEIDSIIVNSRNNGHSDSFFYDDVTLTGTSHNPAVVGI